MPYLFCLFLNTLLARITAFAPTLSSSLVAILNSPLAGYALGSILPPLIAILTQPKWPKWMRTAVMLAVCFISALTVALKQAQSLPGGVTSEHVAALFLQTTVATLVLYAHVYKPFGLGKWEEFSTALTGGSKDAVAQAGGIVAYGKQLFGKGSTGNTESPEQIAQEIAANGPVTAAAEPTKPTDVDSTSQAVTATPTATPTATADLPEASALDLTPTNVSNVSEDISDRFIPAP